MHKYIVSVAKQKETAPSTKFTKRKIQAIESITFLVKSDFTIEKHIALYGCAKTYS